MRAVSCSPQGLIVSIVPAQTGLRKVGPQRLAISGALTQTGSPDPRIDLVCITSSCPRQFLENFKRHPVAWPHLLESFWLRRDQPIPLRCRGAGAVHSITSGHVQCKRPCSLRANSGRLFSLIRGGIKTPGTSPGFQGYFSQTSAVLKLPLPRSSSQAFEPRPSWEASA